MELQIKVDSAPIKEATIAFEELSQAVLKANQAFLALMESIKNYSVE